MITDISAKGNELFDFSDEETRVAYDDLKKSAKSEAISRDTSSWQEIEDAVRKTTGSGIVIADGAYPHIIGAIVHLAKSSEYNIRYVPVADWQISTKTTQDKIHDSSGHVSIADLKVQMTRDIGVTKHLGFDDMESVRTYLDSLEYDPAKPTLTFVVFNQTGLHHLYNSGSFKEASERHTQNILNHVTDSPPGFVLATGEDWNMQGYGDMLAGKSKAHTSLQQLFVTIKASGIPMHVDAFGHRDRDSFGHRSFDSPFRRMDLFKKSDLR